jgi:hypothetical protein
VKTSLLFSNRRLKPSSNENSAIVEQIQIIMIIVIRNIPILLSSSNYVVSEASFIYNYVADKAFKSTDLLIKLLETEIPPDRLFVRADFGLIRCTDLKNGRFKDSSSEQ